MPIGSLITHGLIFTPSLMITEGLGIGPPSNPSTGGIPTSPAYLSEHQRSARTPIHQVQISPSGTRPNGYWKLDELAGVNRVDTMRNTDLIPIGSGGSSPGSVGNAAQFVRASGQYLQSGDLLNDILTMGDISAMIIANVWLDSKPATMSLVSQYGSGSRSYQLRYESVSNRYSFTIRNLAGVEAEVFANNFGSPATGEWHHIVAWRDRATGTINISVNDISETPVVTAIIPNLVDEDFRLGANWSGGVAGDFFDGRMRDVWFLKNVLSTVSRTTLYNGGTVLSWEDFTAASSLFNFCTSWPVTSEDIGEPLLQPIELSKRVDVELWRFPLTTFVFDLYDFDNVVTDMLATGVIGAIVKLYQGFYDLEWAATPVNYALLFTGVIGEYEYNSGRYRFTARSPMTAAADKIVFMGATTTLSSNITATDSTLSVGDASAFEAAANLPQTARKLAALDREIVVYRGKTTTQLNNVIRTGTYGYFLPPAAGEAVAHNSGTVIRELIATGVLVPENSAAARDDLHPINTIISLLTERGKRGIGEAGVPINFAEFKQAKLALGLDLQFMYVFSDGISAKKLLEEIYRDLAAYPTENEAGEIGIKLYQNAGSAAPVGNITDAHITDFPRWVRNAERIVNKVITHYNYMPTTREYMSTYEYSDETLIAAIGREITLEIFSKGIRKPFTSPVPGSPYHWFDATPAFLLARAQAHIARFGGLHGAHVIACQCLLDRNLLQPSNDILASFSQVINLSAAERDVTDAPMEIVQMRHLFEHGRLECELLQYPD